MSPHPLDDTTTQNASQLHTLSRTLRLSEGQFSLLVVRCNYTNLREQVVRDLGEQSPLPIREFQLPRGVQSLYGTIQAELDGEEEPSVLMVYGLEAVRDLDEVLDATNFAREAFRNFSFPLVLWIDDNLWKKMNRRAQDFTSWATTYEFVLGTQELLEFLEGKARQVFAGVQELGALQFVPNGKILGFNSASELELAYRDLKRQIDVFPAELEGSLKFVLGRFHYAHHEIDSALKLYQESLEFWRQNAQVSHASRGDFSHLEWQGILLFHIGLCDIYQAEQYRHGSSYGEWERAKQHLQQCIQRFELARRQDLVAKFINKLGEVLRQLEDWKALWELAIASRKLHQTPGTLSQVLLAQDYGFLAEVALRRREWSEARELAEVALDILVHTDTADALDDSIFNQHQGRYLWLLSEALEKLGQPGEAIQKLEWGKRATLPQYNPQLYLKILDTLHRLYFDRGEYREAFEIKREYRTKSSIFGYTAFIGAGRLQPRERAIDPALADVDSGSTFADEIQASGREKAIAQLLNRMASSQHKLTVIYGQSGVGKSSLLRAGLVPALQRRHIDARQVMPVVISSYNSYIGELDRKLAALQQAETPAETQVAVDTGFTDPEGNKPDEGDGRELIQKIIENIKKNCDRNRLTVIVFDQFEELFFVLNKKGQKSFFELLRDILDIPFVKVILSVREDYLHHLLKSVRLTDFDAINNDILSKDILFYLGNFTPKEAYDVIKSLADRSHFYLEDALIETLVDDLSGELGEVRPIEMQVVGAQLQTENITTLAEYQNRGPKQKLVERFLEVTIRDCGAENERMAKRMLYLLTDENDTRPLRTRSELEEELRTQLHQPSITPQLDLILHIFEQSGLISREVEVDTEFYQLVHDYLAGFIRHQHQSDRDAQFEQLQEQNQELRREQELHKKLEEARQKQRQAEDYLKRERRIRGLIGVGVAVLLMGFAGWEMQKRQRNAADRLVALQSVERALRLSDENNQLEILLTALRVSTDILETQPNPQQKFDVTAGLREVISGLQEQNRLQGHASSVLGIAFSPDGDTIATAGNDGAAKLWSRNGAWLQDLPHEASVTSVAFSPESRRILTTTADNRVTLWIWDGEAGQFRWLQTLAGHTDLVTRAKFSPDGNIIATASNDKTIRLWRSDGTPLRVLEGHTDKVLDVEFSPDGQKLASGSKDKTVRVWNLSGEALGILKGHCDSIPPELYESCSVHDVSFNPQNGNILVSGSGDRTVKLWDLQAKAELVTLKGHNEDVLSVSFSPDGEAIASSSRDDTVKIWAAGDGNLLNTLVGHQNDIWSVAFTPDGQTVASASADTTVKLWSRSHTPEAKVAILGHNAAIWSVSFSPDGRMVATAGNDGWVKLWDVGGADGSLLWQLDSQVPPNDLNWVSFSPDPDDPILATPGADNRIRLWNLDGSALATLEGHTLAVNAVAFDPTGDLVASASADRTVKVWTRSGELVETLQIPALPPNGAVSDLHFSADGSILGVAIGSETGGTERNEQYSVKLWRREGTTWVPYPSIPYPESVNSIAFSPEPGQLAVASGKTVKLWTRDRSVQPDSCPMTAFATVRSLSYSPDGKILATASDDKKIRLWAVKRDRDKLWPEGGCSALKSPIEPITTIDQNVFVNRIRFSPDGRTIAIAKDDGTLMLWSMDNLDLDSLIARSCDWLQDYLETNPKVEGRDRDLCE
ncbi:AAA family ATPase [Lyngbya sp. CCY1209]|uniref:nSTAND1 domain-containing NTPase n=1 Tax=Lyngbya sp. CCY1209 TaxID=2886103 RepID=UPI002D201AD3|nr:AAA family ATPase [Lyngbya sp. CCY1209]MEB3885335.1 AAA family ATPase [Lyngbya sp. CCY1209]